MEKNKVYCSDYIYLHGKEHQILDHEPRIHQTKVNFEEKYINIYI